MIEQHLVEQLYTVLSSTKVSFDSIQVFLHFVRSKSNIPNNSTKAVCSIYGLLSYSSQDEVFKLYFDLRQRSIKQILSITDGVTASRTTREKRESIFKYNREWGVDR